MGHGTKNSRGPIPAAQYIRMSTEHQRFSPDNQRAANMAYAAANGYEIVATYQDNGKSGLTLKARPELKRLLSDVLSGLMPYRAILVLDVSRWGRFQDADQAAHYEFMCREAGIPVRYCSEAFDNDGGAMASIVKHMKRVMAAEYSRDLSTKISRAQRQQAGLGYKQGGITPFGTRRQVVDHDGRPKLYLSGGERKALATDKVLFARGPASEVNLIKSVFHMYAVQNMTMRAICLRLSDKRKFRRDGKPWSTWSIAKMLRNEIYIGTYIFGRCFNNLGNKKRAAEAEWVKAGVLEPIVAPELFNAAKVRLDKSTRRFWSDQDIEDGLSRLLKEQGFLNVPTINACPYLPDQTTITKRFGGLAKACAAIGYVKPSRASTSQRQMFTDEDLLAHLKRIHLANGEISATLINQDRHSPSSSYFKTRLGGLRNAYFLAGLSMGKLSRQKAARQRDGSMYGEKELLDGLRLVLAKHGHLSKRLIAAEPTIPGCEIYEKKFGCFSKAYARIGYFSTRSELCKATWARWRVARAERFEAPSPSPDDVQPLGHTKPIKSLPHG